MGYQALALDLDGTLTNSQKVVTERTKEAVKEAIREGVQIILASGRPVLGIWPVVKTLELDRYGGYVVAYNGGEILECHTGKVLQQAVIPVAFYQKICQIGRKYQVQPLTYDNKSVLSEKESDFYVQKEARNNGAPILQVDCLEKVVNTPVVKFMLVGKPEELAKAARCLKQEFGNSLNVFFSEPYFLEVVSPGVEKASALARLLQYLSIKREDLIACGDGLNDIPMLQYAGLSVAMENAYSEVKKLADYITGSNDKDGVASVIEKYILTEKGRSKTR